jgi:hypothetical protein
MFVATLLLFSVLHSFSTEYVFPEKLPIKAVAYNNGADMPTISCCLQNMSTRAFDSLEIRIFLTCTVDEAPDTFTNIAARVDIAVLYRTDGFQDTLPVKLREELWKSLYSQRLHKMEDTYDSITKKYHWYLSIPLNSITIESGRKIRLDLVWDSWELTRYKDHMNQAPSHVFGETDWSYGSKRCSQGMPIEFGGIYIGTKDDADTRLSEDPYIAVYRKGDLLWGVPPDWKKYYGNAIDTVKSNVPVINHFNNFKTHQKYMVKIVHDKNMSGFAINSDTPLTNVLITSTAGRIVNRISFTYANNSTIFNVPAVLSPGIYLIGLKFNDGIQLTKKIIIED